MCSATASSNFASISSTCLFASIFIGSIFFPLSWFSFRFDWHWHWHNLATHNSLKGLGDVGLGFVHCFLHLRGLFLFHKRHQHVNDAALIQWHPHLGISRRAM